MTATATAPAAPPPPGEPRTPGEALDLLAARRATGALHGPLGTLHLVGGLVTAAESPRAPGLADLLTGSGRITPGEWADLLGAHGPHSRVAAALVERRLLTRGELELGHLGTLFDAAFFVLADPAGGTWRYEADTRHWLGEVAAVDPDRLHREVERRRRLLDGLWPSARLDTEPVRPSERGRHPEHRTAGRRRRELLDRADGRRTPADLARLLGRSGFGVTADVRRLAAAGLLETAEGLAEVAAEGVPTVRRGLAGLHRRVPGATLRAAPAPARSDHPPATAAAHPLTVPDPDVALLTRVRDLLEARL
ncbi:transcriptional regulator [Kitasatospora sp. NPDC101183]|uniref:transcriptional regulator n=1 Tax=Kitasatospora sp. NPDC101183 TaxID=3364100 RepID=UPI003810EF69